MCSPRASTAGPAWAWPSGGASRRSWGARCRSTVHRDTGPASPFACRLTSPILPRQWMPPEMPKILLVEDNEASADALARRLERRDYVVRVAADGVQAVEMAKSEQP